MKTLLKKIASHIIIVFFTGLALSQIPSSSQLPETIDSYPTFQIQEYFPVVYSDSNDGSGY